MVKSFIIILLALMSSNLWAQSFGLKTDNKSEEAAKLLLEVERLIPSRMKDIIKTQINVKFSNLNGQAVDKLNFACDQKLVLGRVIRMLPGQKEGSLELDNVLLNGILNVQKLNCSHKDTLTYAKAILLHEISHFFDHKEKVSSDATFLNLSGWISKGVIVKKRTNLNKSNERSPDIYELKDPAETFAVNFEFYILDKNYQCRRPSYNAYYVRLFGESVFDSSECEMNKKVSLITQSLEKKPILTKEIDPSRIYQIHYLFAGKGKEMMSRWGHAMFRLVICAPGREIGPDCLQDFANHIVVSYRANVEDMTTDYVKGMNGSYASQLFLMNMNDVVNEYTKGEFRDVISLPIVLNRSQIKLFTDKLLENYWGYQGSYFFITNNCASEAMNLLRAAYPGNKLMQTQSITTPLGLYDFLIKSKLVNNSVIDNTKEAIYYGYLFPGVSEKLLASLRVFNSTMEFEKFAIELSAEERKAIYAATLTGLEGKKKMSGLANALRLEDQILISREQQFAKKIGSALFGKEASNELKDTELDERMIEIRDAYKRLAGSNFITKGYGIPLSSEFSNTGDAVAEEVMELVKRNSDELKEIVTTYFPKEVHEMQKTMENRFYLLTEISKSY